MVFAMRRLDKATATAFDEFKAHMEQVKDKRASLYTLGSPKTPGEGE